MAKQSQLTCLTLALIAAGCTDTSRPLSGESGQPGDETQGSSAAVNHEGPCEGRSEQDCDPAHCKVQRGVCRDESGELAWRYAGCGSDGMCSGAITCAVSPDGVCLFTGGGDVCIPPEWPTVNSPDPHEADCSELVSAVNEVDGGVYGLPGASP